MAQFQVLQPETTYTGSAIAPLAKGLPKNTQSLCPDCGQLIEARIFEDAGKVVMEKRCDKHGDFRDIVYSDARLYLKMEEWTFGDNRGLENPAVTNATRCPDDCGLCNLHTSHTGLANVDLTNRCNLTCPVCFANANVAGLRVRAGFRDWCARCSRLCAMSVRWPAASSSSRAASRPSTRASSTFSGWRGTWASRTRRSRPTASNSPISNSPSSAKRPGCTRSISSSTVSATIFTAGPAASASGRQKLQCIENVRRAGLKIVFVPTIVKGLNDHQIGDIVRLALEYIECTSGISFQPVAFTGRIAKHELEAKRFTLADFAHAVHQQTGIADPYQDWFPLSCVTPFSKLISALRGEETTTLSCHPHCSLGTYLFVDQNRKATPVTQFVDVGPMLQDMDTLARKAGTRRVKFFTKLSAWNNLRKHFHQDRAPEGLNFQKFLQTLQGLTDKKYGRGDSEKKGFTYRTLMLAGMHFMDSYNYDVERVKRCVIHYAAPNGLIYPFCAYNSGPVYRERIEKEFAVPAETAKELQRLTVRAKMKIEPELVGSGD